MEKEQVTSRNPDRPVAVVAVGASAGGLDPMRAIIEHIPNSSGLAFVFAQHLDPTRVSSAPELARQWTSLPVIVPVDREPLRANHLYLIPAGQQATIERHHLVLRPTDNASRPKHPISDLFCSLADSHRQKAIGVVLSGTGGDGSQGVSAIRQAHGLTIAETPESAQFPGMPEAAIATGHIDVVCPPGSVVGHILRHVHRTVAHERNRAQSQEDEQPLVDQLLACLGNAIGNDFSGYKPTTVRRRIDRRMGLRNIASLAEYLSLVESDPEEMRRLADDMLIGVTSFYRDPEAFDLFARDVIPNLFADKNANEPVRAWVAGCATGEEAYTVACLLFAHREATGRKNPIQVFASDIDTEALDFARSGVYANSTIEMLPTTLRDRYFSPQDGQWRIIKDVREAIVFALHNLVSDPPFSRLDLVVCRNVLIYLDQRLQQHLMEMFSVVLNRGGCLFLGSSETIGTQQKNFSTLSKQWRLFRNEREDAAGSRQSLMPRSALSYRGLSAEAPSQNSLERGADKNYRSLAERHGPATLLVSPMGEVLYSSGQTSQFLELPQGEPSLDLYAMLNPSLRSSVRHLINKVVSDRTTLVALGQLPEKTQAVRITGRLVSRAPDDVLVLLALEEESAHPLATAAIRPEESWLVAQLEQELQATRDDLHRTIDKLSVSNEDLKAINEEFMAMNEELQSANEELESSKEELQSLNEELQTTNNALDAKVLELQTINSDLSNLFGSTDIAALFLDNQFHLKRFSPATRRLIALIPGDIGRPITDIASELVNHALLDGAEEVIRTGQTREFEVQDKKGHHYLKRVLPYHRNDNQTDGVVITFSDVTALKNAKDEAQAAAHRLQMQSQLLELPLVFARDMNDRIIFWNKGAENFYGWSSEEAVGQNAHVLLNTEFPEPLPGILEKIHQNERWQGELKQVTKIGQTIIVSSQWVIAREADNQPWAIVEVNTDVSERKHVESQFNHLLRHDPLTHLPNQTLLVEKIRTAVNCARERHQSLALMLFDLDRFKTINDSLGHEIGNRLLVAVADRIKNRLDTDCALARFGGDEFAVLVENVPDITRLSSLANDLLVSLREVFFIDGNPLYTGASIGVSVFPDDTLDADTLVHYADAAMNLAKEQGRGQCQFFKPELNRRAHRSLAIETQLRSAIKRQELTLVYQPQVEIDSGNIIGAEALLRWHNPELGLVSPAEFIPVAEETGIIVELGEWVFSQVFELLQQRHRARLRPVRFSLNISPVQFRKQDFLKMVTDHMAVAEFPAHLLELELTERVLVGAPEQAIAFFGSLQRLGLRLSFDDFGTGYCSLQYLRHLRLSHLKVAREFIPTDDTDLDNRAISRSIVSLANALEIECTVEGIEDKHQLEFFEAEGCQFCQGFLFSKPLALADFEALLGRDEALRPS